MTPFQTTLSVLALIASIMMCYFLGFKDGQRAGIGEGAELQKNGRIVWDTNSVTNVTFKIKE